jgi:4-amino-4-deoxy-L-arabinose transferase-like glycosyltransferase
MRTRLRKFLFNPDFQAVAFLTLFVAAIYLPNLGAYAFWDPWETHYSQVAFEMAEKGTWMDPWYRGLNNWWSKPILPLWGLRASYAAFGITSTSDPWLHFAGRLPFFLLSLMGLLLTFRWVSRLFSRRAGVIASLVLATMPFWALLSHQIMFDLPFMAFCAPAIGHYFLARSGDGRPRDLLLFYGLTAGAFLSKWLLALFLPLGIFVVYLGLRWDVAVFSRVGWKHWLGGLAFLAVAAGYFFWAVRDPAFAGMLSLVMAALVMLYWMGRDAAVEAGFGGRWANYGLLLFVGLAAPWHVFMIAKHGWPFLREAVIYHHFDRAAGTIGKPEGTFDVFVKQIGFGCFPWIAFLPAALIRLLKWSAADLEGHGRRVLWLALSVLVPYTAFSLFQTKFHHYIFPVVPGIAVLVGVYLDRMAREDDRAWMRLSLLLTAPVSAILLVDALHDYQWFVHLFDYYYGWPPPRELNPYPYFAAVGGGWLLVLAWTFFRRRLGTGVVVGLCATAAALSVFLTAWLLPRVTRTYTQEPHLHAYLRATDGQDVPIAQYNGWLSRSVSFYFRNKVIDLSQANQPNLRKALDFLGQPGRRFMILGAGYGRDCKTLLAELRPEVQEKLGKSLYVVFDQHPFSCLVSTERDPEGERRVRDALVAELPATARPMPAPVLFGQQIELLGWELEPPEVRRGGTFRVSYYFRARDKVTDDWLVFIHGDGPQEGAHRVFGDHAPVGGLLPTSEWPVGQIIRNDHEMQVPANYPYDNFSLWMGFWKGPRRMPVIQRHLHDGADRVRTALVRVK